uniref:hypothetical protein n=1 Tax=Frateuria defendens TaxID=2219559 RepID=UPI0013791F03
VLTAQQLLNSGRIASQGLTALSAGGDILNTNGRISGGVVSLVAGGDIRSTSLGGLAHSGLPAASLSASQGLQIL